MANRSFKDITGQRFGRLTVVKRIDRRDGRWAWWECLCECGRTTEQAGAMLRAGRRTWCGECIQDGVGEGMLSSTEMRTADLAYAAGIIDGEGCIHASGYRQKYSIMVTVSNTNYHVIKWLHDRWPGALYRKQNKKHPRHKDAHVWRIYGLQAFLFLKSIRAFLIIKAPQAECALSALAIYHAANSNSASFVESRRARQADIYDTLRILNHRGKWSLGPLEKEIIQ